LVTRLRRDGKLVARDLAQELGVSEESLRRDLRDLAAAGLCQRVYGGALPFSPATGAFTARLAVGTESKRLVAGAPRALVSRGSTVILVGRAADTYVLASAEKLGTVPPYNVVGASEVAGIITDAGPEDSTVRQLSDQGVQVIHAG
jgi:DeoR/GlpR family transcriptional regulator of sugar metabolism